MCYAKNSTKKNYFQDEEYKEKINQITFQNLNIA